MIHLLKRELDEIQNCVQVGAEISGVNPRRRLETVAKVRKALADQEAVTLQALRNVGIDTECGACVCQAFTGSNIAAHTCTESTAIVGSDGKVIGYATTT